MKSFKDWLFACKTWQSGIRFAWLVLSWWSNCCINSPPESQVDEKWVWWANLVSEIIFWSVREPWQFVFEVHALPSCCRISEITIFVLLGTDRIQLIRLFSQLLLSVALHRKLIVCDQWMFVQSTSAMFWVEITITLSRDPRAFTWDYSL